LYGSTELTGYATQKRLSYEVQQIGNQEHAKGYGTHKKVSYEVQPISDQECAKRIREVLGRYENVRRQQNM
jgi:hypothetical protein